MLATAVNSAQESGLIPDDREGFIATGTAPMTCTPTVTVRITVRIMRAAKRAVRGSESITNSPKGSFVSV